MPLTPADIHHVEFARTALGRRGYDEEQVDALLDEAAQELVRLIDENDELRRRAEAAAEPVPAGPGEAEVAAAAAELERARQGCEQAEEQARRLASRLRQARQAPAAVVPGGENLDRVLAMAQRTADGHVQEAHQESHALITAARERSQQILGEARMLVTGIEREAHQQHREAIAAVQSNRDGMLREIDELTRVAVGYRAALGDHLSGQCQRLDGATADDPS
ncbi:DivIVA domain-containing protein [Actinoplanes teichomyceticus]|uniref:Cell wall synthesis protein Wag31 n=1 Tax=Actinoplanes teichomyceticus TaxID=1867 RepID=A0A561VLH7_ACTTI|nr:DivIVA domain-containing protein [Actinoplanes teichomyceticus]TWG12457.1 DivIVA domain-containing protein [Actinoplanes teichomyceticus]GIF13820.1 hypothetical protein Ate01nite_38520 [Actinoplanes teichomyceticus]